MGESRVEKVSRLAKMPEHIRNIAICAHIDHGKTTFSDNLLAGAGMMSGELAGKACQLDFHEDEQSRGITIDSAAVSMVHECEGEEYLINLIDTPGHVDFGGDVTRAMRAVDGAVVLACAVEGVMPQTETVLRQALKERVKPILFINKVDRMIKEQKLTPEAMQNKFVEIINHVNKLIGEIAEEDYKEEFKVNVADGSVCFGSAFHNWAMSINYMKKKELSFKDIIDAYQGDETYKELGKKAPLHEVILDAVIKHNPNPVKAQKYRIPKIWNGDPESEFGKSLMKCDPDGEPCFVITKIVVDPQAGEIAAGRLFSGVLQKGTEVYCNVEKAKARVQQIFIYNGAKREIVPSAVAGNVIGIGGVKAFPGETITINEHEPFEAIKHIFQPVITKAIEAAKPSDLPKLIEVLRQVSKEDPTVKIEINEETGEHLLHGMGELHLEIIENRIRSEKGVDIKTSNPIVVYRETITTASEQAEGKSPNKHNKFYFTVEPLDAEMIQALKEDKIPEGRVKKKDLPHLNPLFQEAGMSSDEAKRVRDICNGNLLYDNTRGIVHMGEVIEMIMDSFEDVMNNGPLARDPCMKVKVIVNDLKLHEDAIHRGPSQVLPAVRQGIRDAMKTAKPLLLEPIQTLLFEAPEEYMGEISKLISNKRGQLLDMQQGGNLVEVKGKIPVAEAFGLSSELRSSTGGRGSSSLVDQNFELLPRELQDNTIKQIRQRKGLSDNE